MTTKTKRILIAIFLLIFIGLVVGFAAGWLMDSITPIWPEVIR